MKKIGTWTFLLGLILPLSVFAAGNADAGKAVYTKKCVACHGADGNGNDKIAQALKVTISPLSSKEVQALSDADLAKRLTEGKGKMPPVKDLSSTDVSNVIAFIRSLAKK